jgi:hypothetical protein
LFGFSGVFPAAAMSARFAWYLAKLHGASLRSALVAASKWVVQASASGFASVIEAMLERVPMTLKALLQMST